MTFIGSLTDQMLHLRIGLGGFNKSALGEVVDTGFLQQPLTHQAVGRLRQLDQAVGAGLADFTLPQPLQKASTTLMVFSHIVPNSVLKMDQL